MGKAIGALQTDARPSGAARLAGRILRQRETGLSVIILIIVALLALARPTTFFTSENLFNILKQVSLVTITAIGQTIVMVSGGIDLSIGFSLGLSGVLLAFFIQQGMDPALAIALGVAASTAAGALNGTLVTRLRLPAFIVTLGIAKITRGVMYVVTRGYPIPVRTPFILWLGNGYVGPIPVPTILMAAFVAAGAFLLSRTVFGNHVKAIGGNEMAAKLAGIRIAKNKIVIFGLAGLLAGIAGVVMVGRVSAGNPNSGLNFDMDSIAAAIIGGTSLSGGEGTIVGTMLGALLLGVIGNGLVLMNVSMYWQTIVAGVIIIAVCGLDAATRSGKSRG